MNNGTVILMLALALLFGTVFGKLAKIVRLPSVTGYLLAGIIFGPSLLGTLSAGGVNFGFTQDFLKKTEIIYITAFSFICFSIGEEIKPKNLKNISGRAAVMSFTQAMGAVILVGGALLVFAYATNERYLTAQAALVLGALAAASAPTAKFMITRQYKTEGEITEMMVPVVALDDIFAIIAFAVAMSVLPTFSGGKLSVLSLVVSPLIEISASIALGIILGVLLGIITKVYKIQNGRVAVCIGFILVGVAVCEIFKSAGLYLSPDGHGHGQGHIALSSPLVSIFMGGAFSFINHEHGIRKKLDSWSYPMFVVFFVLAGARVNLSDFFVLGILLVALIYTAFRFLGKYYGARAGGMLLRESKNMQRYLGVTLLPQADIAIGMAAIAAVSLSAADASLVEGVVFIAAMVFEIMGHIWIRHGLKKAGEIHGDIDAVVSRLKLVKPRYLSADDIEHLRNHDSPSVGKNNRPPKTTPPPNTH